ncbi:hypothetical protein C8J56DRAFT_1064538 [Mycena floridula]|nr:hypothetical protein C8J56DRAFT_1064538 [Mycena floridula]
MMFTKSLAAFFLTGIALAIAKSTGSDQPELHRKSLDKLFSNPKWLEMKKSANDSLYHHHEASSKEMAAQSDSVVIFQFCIDGASAYPSGSTMPPCPSSSTICRSLNGYPFTGPSDLGLCVPNIPGSFDDALIQCLIAFMSILSTITSFFQLSLLLAILQSVYSAGLGFFGLIGFLGH